MTENQITVQKHLTKWDAFDEIQSKIETILITDLDIAEQETERNEFENRFYAISGLFKKNIKKFCSASPVTPSLENSQSGSLTELGGSGSYAGPPNQSSFNPISIQTVNSNEPILDENHLRFHARFELPKLKTPTFHGTFDGWLTFHDSFKSMCHDNPALSPIQKFHYLKTCLKDEAAEIIAALETNSQNYDVAWELLKNRYDNRKHIVEMFIKSLFDLPNVSKDLSIRALLDGVQKRVRALKALGQPVDHWDSLLIHIIRGKLNNYTREKWEESVGSTVLPSFSDMTNFLERRSLIENTQSFHKENNSQKPHSSKNHSQHFNSKPATSCISTSVETKESNSESFQYSCPVCSEKHPLYRCDQFLNMQPPQRYRTIDCRRGPCSKCRKRHNSLLHFSEKQSEDRKNNPEYSTRSLVSLQRQARSQVVLGTAIVDVLDSKGQYKPCRAYLDSCCQCCSISEKLADVLGIEKKTINIKLKGVNNIQSNVKNSALVKIKSRYGDSVDFHITCLVFQEISELTPVLPIDRNSLKIPSDIFLADPEFHQPAEVDLLIGAEYFYNLMRAGKIAIKGQSAIFQETDFDWIFSGRYDNPQPTDPQIQYIVNSKKSQVTCNAIKFQDIPLLWELGDENPSKILSEEEAAAEKIYVETVKRDDTGRYCVKLPFSHKKELLGDSHNIAFRRFYALEKKFGRNPEFHSRCSDCMQGYIDEGHLNPISNQEISNFGFYLPHHAVIKNDNITTKTRVVFDASAKTSTGISLNDTFMIGATIQDNLYSIVTRFRSFPYALSADIQQMYRQILVFPEDRKFQRILWRQNMDQPIKIYSLNRVTFGTTCAPHLAIRTLHQLAADEQEVFPLASNILKRDFYVDDLLTGAQTSSEAVMIRNELIDLSERRIQVAKIGIKRS